MFAWEWLIVAALVGSAPTALAAGIIFWRSRCQAVMGGGFFHAGQYYLVYPEPEQTELRGPPQSWRGAESRVGRLSL